MSNDAPVIVVGAGLAGLACAQRLSLAGHEVVVLEASDGSEPFAALVSLPRAGAEDDLVDEVYREYESSVWQGGEFDPVYALEVVPDDPASLSTFKTALAVAKRSFELTDIDRSFFLELWTHTSDPEGHGSVKAQQYWGPRGLDGQNLGSCDTWSVSKASVR